jgi:hypothetical protein
MSVNVVNCKLTIFNCRCVCISGGRGKRVRLPMMKKKVAWIVQMKGVEGMTHQMECLASFQLKQKHH